MVVMQFLPKNRNSRFVGSCLEKVRASKFLSHESSSLIFIKQIKKIKMKSNEVMADDRFCQKNSISILFDKDTPQEVLAFIPFSSHSYCQSLISASNRSLKKDIGSL